jgi:RimJ/RimL family protein N-acetyltransferase
VTDHRRAAAEFEIRAAVDADLDACARIQAESGEPGTPGKGLAVLRKTLTRPDRWLWVAARGGEIEGYARLTRTHPAPAPDVPAGFYLGGVTVARRARRRGIGLALTRARLEYAFGELGATCVWYFANARNHASIALHAKLGFQEVRRPFDYPGVRYEGGVGVLFVLERDAWSVPPDPVTR